jgi:sugar-specific transcriptional regulator TrmB
MKKKLTDISQRTISQNLAKIGLSKQEAKVYLVLLNNGSLNAKKLAKLLNIIPNSIYRLLIQLQNRKLITVSGKYPSIYKAISPSIALDVFTSNKVIEINSIKDVLIQSLTQPAKNDQSRIDIIHGQSEFFLNYSQFAGSAKSQILIISIGEEVSEEILLANRDAIAKGIKIWFIAHKHNENNHYLLLNWIKMGLEVKHFPDSGFHLVVFDKKISLLAVNNPDNTNDRTGLLIYNSGLSKALSDYFYSIWEKAEDVCGFEETQESKVLKAI